MRKEIIIGALLFFASGLATLSCRKSEINRQKDKQTYTCRCEDEFSYIYRVEIEAGSYAEAAYKCELENIFADCKIED